MNRVKRFFQIAKSVLNLISKLLPLVGDILECIKMVDTLVDSFVEKREKGELKDVSFVDYSIAIINLIGELAPLGYNFFDVCETLVEYAKNYKKSMEEINASNIRE